MLQLSVVKQYCRISGDAEDDMLNIIIADVEQRVSNMTGLQWTQSAGVSQIVNGGGRHLWIIEGPLTSIDTIKEFDSGVEITTSGYHLQDDRRILRDGNARWADIPYEVIGTVGYDGADNVPGDLLGAMYGLCGRVYRQKGGIDSESAGQHSMSWKDLQDTDEMATIRHYKLGNRA